MRYFKKSQCGFKEDVPQVCCQKSSEYKEYKPNKPNILVSRFGNESGDVCGEQELDNRIVSGTISGIDEFPWMALLKYRTSKYNSDT